MKTIYGDLVGQTIFMGPEDDGRFEWYPARIKLLYDDGPYVPPEGAPHLEYDEGYRSRVICLVEPSELLLASTPELSGGNQVAISSFRMFFDKMRSGDWWRDKATFIVFGPGPIETALRGLTRASWQWEISTTNPRLGNAS